MRLQCARPTLTRLDRNSKQLNDFINTTDGATFTASLLPCLIICAISPYTFHLFSYDCRIICASLCSSLGLVLLGAPHFMLHSEVEEHGPGAIASQIIGYVCLGFGFQIGECTLLPYCASYGKEGGRRYISAYSSGTGLGSVFGGAFGLVMLNVRVDAGETALLSLIFPAMYAFLFFGMVRRRSVRRTSEGGTVDEANKAELGAAITPDGREGMIAVREYTRDRDSGLTLLARARFVLSLMHYIVPLALVFFAEYTIISGLWSSLALGSINVAVDRHSFYVWSYFAYQCGVFVSRSSGILIKANMKWLYVVPALQCIMLGLFAAVASTQFWTGWSLLVPCFFVGCLGGFSYVQTYAHMSDNVVEDRKEMAISAATVGENFGTTLASALSIFIQASLWSDLRITA